MIAVDDPVVDLFCQSIGQIDMDKPSFGTFSYAEPAINSAIVHPLFIL